MTDLHKAAKAALWAFQYHVEQTWPTDRSTAAIAALRAALVQQAEPVEPVAYIHRQGNHWEVSERFLLDDEKARGWTEEPLYTAPPQRKPLTEEVAALAAQRDALLEACKRVKETRVFLGAVAQEMLDAAIKAVEETK